MRQRHYHVTENTPGYLPDSEPATFTSRRAAESYAADLARELRADGYRVSGSRGYYAAEHRDPDSAYSDLGRAIELATCYESDCLAHL